MDLIEAAIKQLSKGNTHFLGEAPEDKEPASPDEASMAMKQAEFIEYVGREIGEHIKAGKEFPEWMQNKLSALHEKSKDMHSTLGAHGGDEDEMNEETIVESHFKHGESVKCKESGMEGEVIDVGNPDEEDKYYTVRRTDGSVMKYAPDELESLEDINEAKMPSEKEIEKVVSKSKDKKSAVMSLMKQFKMSKDEAETIMDVMSEEGGAGEEGTDELTKKYKKDTPMEEVSEAYKTPEEAQAFEDGKKAARKGKKYSDNPHKDGKLKTAWSKGHNKIRESVDLEEKAVSQAQQKLMGMALAYKRGELSDNEVSDQVKSLARNMSEKDLEDFAKTKHDEIPVKKEAKNAKQQAAIAIAKKEKLDGRTRTFKEKLKRLGYAKTVKEDLQSLIDEGKDSHPQGSAKYYRGAMDKYKAKTPKKSPWDMYMDKKKTKKEGVTEKRKDSAQDLYFNTYSAAIQTAIKNAEKQGYEVDEDDVFTQVTTGQGKPGRGKTVRHTLKLTKNGKEQRKALHIQVYNRDTNKNTYELNHYIS